MKILFFGLIFILFAIYAYSASTEEQALEEAKNLHSKAVSDPILYSTEEFKALYQQNLAVIEILKDLREIAKDILSAQQQHDQELIAILNDLRNSLMPQSTAPSQSLT